VVQEEQMSDKTERDAQEMLDHRDDPGEWSDEAESVEVKPSRSEVISFRLPSEELDALEVAAAGTGETISEFVRRALALRLYGEPIGPSIEISSGATRLTVRSHIIVGSHKDAPASFVPDIPPLTIAMV
jgi:Ribbon-helix-helix protein, copG family